MTVTAFGDCANRGMTGVCASGRHEGCPYRANAALPDGIWLPECYVTLPHAGGRHGSDPFQGAFTQGVVAQLPDIGSLQVVKPSHIYKCPCQCHIGGEQIELFGVAS